MPESASKTEPISKELKNSEPETTSDSSGSEGTTKKITFQPFLDKDYDCPLCQKKLKHRWELRNHLHTEKKHYPEDHPYQFEIDDYLEQLEINPDLIPEGTICDHCQKELRDKYSRKRHEEKCRLNPISPNYRPPTPEWIKEYNANLDAEAKLKRASPRTNIHDNLTNAHDNPVVSSNSNVVSSNSNSAETISRILRPGVRATILKHALFNITTGGPREVTIEPLYPIYISPVDGKLKILFDLDIVNPD